MQITTRPFQDADLGRCLEIERAAVTKANPRLTAHTVQSMLWGAARGWTTLTANKSSVKAILRDIRAGEGGAGYGWGREANDATEAGGPGTSGEDGEGREAVEKAAADAAKAGPRAEAADRLRAALREARDVLAFRPTMEAPLPEGFPDPTPVGVVRVKKYPAYRLANPSTKVP